VDREEGLQHAEAGQVLFTVVAESATNEPSRLVAASIGLALPADPSHHGYISEHHSYGQNEVAAGEYAEDLAASMLGTVLGVPFDPDKAWGRAPRTVAAVGRDRAHDERDLDGGMRGGRALDDRGVGVAFCG